MITTAIKVKNEPLTEIYYLTRGGLIVDKIYVRNPDVRLRSEPFGGFAWQANSSVKKLTHQHMQLLYALEKPQNYIELRRCFGDDILDCWNDVISHKLVQIWVGQSQPICENELSLIRNRISIAQSRTIMRPFWVHLQPFVFCNQNCVHCYCDAGSSHLPFKDHPIASWKLTIDKLIKFGVWDIYVTGGENLIVDECFELVNYIRSMGATPAMSTNGMHVTQNTLDKIKEVGLSLIQVSLDGATEKTNDYMRGRSGAFKKTIEGIRKLSSITRPVINCVVSCKNRHEVEPLVILGKTLGVTYFKFFPQKLVGRSQKKDILSDQQILELVEECGNLSEKHGVRIETFDFTKPCGSGISGFAINENFDIIPCIFGAHDNQQICGNALRDDLETIWFDSPTLSRFRDMHADQPCHRCEPKLLSHE